MNSKISFGTDGIRGNANSHPFDNESLKTLGFAIAQWSNFKYKKNPKVLIAHDSRISGERIKDNLIKGLCNLSLEIIDAGILPTPAVCKLVQKKDLEFDFGIIISASHNPYQDNGIKIVDKKNGKLSIDDESEIVKNYEEISKNSGKLEIKPVGNVKIEKKLGKIYQEEISYFFKKDFLKNTKIILDCSNGATSKVAPEIFKQFGANVITIFNSPNGTNINNKCGSTHPEELQKKVIENNAQIGFAFDGDGDRVIAVNKNGELVCGDKIVAILSEHNTLSKCNTIVGTIMTNLGLNIFLEKNNKKLVRTNVGDKYVAKELEKNQYLLGGESSGHIIMMDYMNMGDGIFTALRFLETIIQKNNWEVKTFSLMPQILINVPISQKKDLKQEPYSQIIEKEKNLLKNGRIVVRYSGTEKLLRVMTEDTSKLMAEKVAKSLSCNLQKALS